MRNILLLLITAFALQACNSTIHLQVLKPADVTLPAEIEKFTIANRSRPNKKNQVWNVVEGVLTGEGLFSDREGAEKTLAGLTEIMLRTPRYTVNLASFEFKGSGTEVFAPPIPWGEVENLCNVNKSQALIVLESFDSDSRVTTSKKELQKKDKEGNPIKYFEYQAQARMEIKSGWRIYYPSKKIIIDEFRATDFMMFDGKGATPEEAMHNLPVKRECVKQAGFFAGKQYGFRISPQWITVSRTLYTRGNDNMKKAARKVRGGNDWNGAMESWKKESLNSNPKIAWKASYNMALASEREGNLNVALEWAEKAYEIGGKGAAMSYTRILRSRIAEQKRLDEQMKTGDQ